MKKILVLAAHPDDEALGCGGMISKLSNDNEIKVITFTNGGGARENQHDRRNDLQTSGEILGFEVLQAFDFPDNELDRVSLLSMNKSIEKVMREFSYSPDVVVTHNPWCLNVDHRKVFECAQTVFRQTRCKLMCFEIPSSSEWNNVGSFTANSYVELSDVHVESKITSLKKAYGNELRDYPHPRSIDNIVNLMKIHGSTIGSKYAERFMSIKEVL